MTATMSAPTPVAGQPGGRHPLQLIALLAGLGPAGAALAGRLTDLTTAVPGARPARTCIDGGHEALVCVGGPTRRLDVQTRDPAWFGSGRRWAGIAIDHAGGAQRWSRTVYGPRDDGAVPHVHTAVDRAGVRAEFAALHSRIGPSARLFSVTEHDDGRVGIGWQLTGGRPGEVFSRAGLGPAWRHAATVIDALHGFPAVRSAGPWSVTATLGSTPQLRFGTTRWARSPDDQGKRRRAEAVARSLGGEAAFVAGAYHLLAHGQGGPARVGRAVEVLVREDAAVQVDLYLAVPARPGPELTVADEEGPASWLG